MKTTDSPSLTSYREALELCRFTEQSSIAERKLAAADTMLEALQSAAALVKTARQYFPKSMHNSDKFDLENTCAQIGAAIWFATEKGEV